MKYVMGWDLPLRAMGIVLGGVLLIGCNSSQSTPITSQTSKYEVAESAAPVTNGTEPAPVTPPAATKAPAAEPAAATIPAVEPPKPSSTPPVAVQSTTETSATIDRTNPQQMADYLEELLSRQPRGATREEAMMRYEATQNEVLEIATALLELNASDEMKQRAAEAKIQAFTILSQLGRKQAEEEMKIFLAQLARNENTELARLGKRMVFAQRMDTIARGDASDVGTLAKELETLLADEKKDMPLFALSTQVARIMMERGTREDALNVMKMTQQAFQDSTDPKIAAQARALAEEVTMVELDLNSKLVSFIQGEANAEQALFDAVQKLLSSPSVGATSLSIVMQIAQVLESRNLEATARLHDMSRAAFEKHADADLAKQAVSSAESFAKRKAIIGRPFTVQGTTLDGRPFDWSAYQGKVVLVDFWATWCGPCLQEMPNIRMNYEQYHDRGFEVVGINLDDNVQAVEQFFSVQKLPWTTVLSPDPNQTG
ncbi:MAG: TlpA disulfide reductase family protein, partial [Pirellulaceae bacterium]